MHCLIRGPWIYDRIASELPNPPIGMPSDVLDHQPVHARKKIRGLLQQCQFAALDVHLAEVAANIAHFLQPRLFQVDFRDRDLFLIPLRRFPGFKDGELRGAKGGG